MEKFPIPQAPVMSEQEREVAEQIISLMKNRNLSYEQAYEILNKTYEELRFRANYLHL